MTDSTNETVEAPKEQSIVEKRRAEVDAKREELTRITLENESVSQDALDAVALAQLDTEERRIDSELNYQRRLKEAREANTPVPNNTGQETPEVTPDVAPVPAPSQTLTPVTPPAPPEGNETAEASAKAAGKGK